ncbi:MAG TPA: hypothetical protein ENN17_07040, partial [bacterium]|nr:hypothetical protein [bacterium]
MKKILILWSVFLIGMNGVTINRVHAQSPPTETGPDLVWYDFEMLSSPGDDWVVGGNVTVRVDIKNQGTVDIIGTPFWVQLYLSSDLNLNTDTDSLLSPAIYCDVDFPRDTTISFEKTVRVPKVPDGNYYIGAWVDSQDDVDEDVDGYAILEDNNKGFVTIQGGPFPVTVRSGLPDLVLTGLTLSTTDWVKGNEVTATVTVTNQGRVPAASHRTRLYLSADQTIDPGDDPLGIIPISFSEIGALSSQTLTQTFTVTTGLPEGFGYVGAIVDIDGEVEETDEGNNTTGPTVQVEVRPGDPDLVWTHLEVSTTQWTVGGPDVTVRLTETNQGQTATTVNHTTQLYLSTDQIIDEDTDWKLDSDNLTFGILSPGQTETITQSVSIPIDLPSGTYSIGAFVDAGRVVTESDEDNNKKMSTHIITVENNQVD